MTNPHPVSERTVRHWRDLVYGRKATDESWESCRPNWMRPDSIQWLRKKSRHPMVEFLGVPGLT